MNSGTSHTKGLLNFLYVWGFFCYEECDGSFLGPYKFCKVLEVPEWIPGKYFYEK